MIKKLLVVLLALAPALLYAQDCFKLKLEMDFFEVEQTLGIKLKAYLSDRESSMPIENDISRNYRVMEEFIPSTSSNFDDMAVVYYDMGILKLAFYHNKLVTIRTRHSFDCHIFETLFDLYGMPVEKETTWDEEGEDAKADKSLCLAWSNKDEIILFYKQEVIKLARRSIPPVEVTGITVTDMDGNVQKGSRSY